MRWKETDHWREQGRGVAGLQVCFAAGSYLDFDNHLGAGTIQHHGHFVRLPVRSFFAHCPSLAEDSYILSVGQCLVRFYRRAPE
jgi:hypothetical protein